MTIEKPSPQKQAVPKAEEPATDKTQPKVREYRGYADQGLAEPTRFGDWEVKGRCSDF